MYANRLNFRVFSVTSSRSVAFPPSDCDVINWSSVVYDTVLHK